MLTFGPCLNDWRSRSFEFVKPFIAVCPVVPGKVDLSMCSFIDDILKHVIIDDHTALSGLRVLGEVGDCLDECLAPAGYLQNRGKEEITPALRTQAENRRMYEVGFSGKVLPHLTSLGFFVLPSPL